MNKKSQIEIMGLIIIVILVAVALLFVLQFTISGKKVTIKTYTQTEIAENMLTTLRYTTTDCYSLTISELLKKCAEQEQGTCPDGNSYCAFVENKVKYLFSETLDKWNKPYILTAFIPDEFNYKINSTLTCKGERQSATHILNTDAGLMTVRLDVCD